MTRNIWMNGALCSEEQARVSPFDHGLLYGDGIFEGVRFYRGVPFRWDAHLDRLERSAAAIRLTVPYDRAQLTAAIGALIAAAGVPDGYVRLLVTRGPGDMGLDPRSCPRPSVILICAPMAVFGRPQQGVSAIIVSTRQTAPDSLDPRLKSLNYLPRVLARMEATAAGADEGIMLNHQGFVGEGSVENLFVWRGETLCTPPATDGALEGITRGVVLDLARQLGLPAREQRLAPYDLHTADELFFTGTGAELVPVRTIDARPLRDCPGPIFRRIAEAYRALIDRESAP